LTAFDPKASAGLFVGVSTFEDTRILGVPYAVDDAVDLAHLFSLELGLVPPERAVLLLAGEPRKSASGERLARLIEKGAKRANARQHDIYRKLEELTQSTGDRGLFILSVATHGVSDQGGDFFVASDSVKGRTLRSGIAVAEVLDEVARADADSGEMGRRLVLLDACRERLTEGTRGENDSAMTKSFAEVIARAKGVAILSGSTLGGFAYDDPERENGVFTAAVLDGLKGDASAGPDGWITVRTLADFVQQRVAAWVRRRRPDHAAKSLGIWRQFEATAEDLPLAPHPEVTQQRQLYRARREAALARARDNFGKILTSQLLDKIFLLLSGEGRPRSDIDQLLEEIEALDGSERSQRCLRDFLRELVGGPDATFTESMMQPTGLSMARPTPSINKPEMPTDPPAGTAFEGPLGMWMRFVPNGTYTIGSPGYQLRRRNNEIQHEVKLTRGFWLGDTPVTRAQWERLVPGPKEPRYFEIGSFPVVGVNWFEVVEFANRLSDHEGLSRCYELVEPKGTFGVDDFTCRDVIFAGLDCQGYRLPTEAEWEIAARAGRDPLEGEPYINDTVAWYKVNSGGSTHPVGQKIPNGWRFKDLLGNVWEWTWDWFDEFSEGLVVDPLGPPKGAARVFRGGSCDSDPPLVRAAYRGRNGPMHSSSNLGFRLARSQSAPQPKGEYPQDLRLRRRGEPE
jgi:formylglycine-generating enzyme required for sulfatase activity